MADLRSKDDDEGNDDDDEVAVVVIRMEVTAGLTDAGIAILSNDKD